MAFQGVYSIIPTAFSDSGELDEASQRRVVDLFIDKGANGLTALGVTGEVARLEEHERGKVLDVVVKQAAGSPFGSTEPVDWALSSLLQASDPSVILDYRRLGGHVESGERERDVVMPVERFEPVSPCLNGHAGMIEPLLSIDRD